METTPTVSKVSVALGDTEKQIIENLENRHGSNFSSALRVIVREWDEIVNKGNYRVLRLKPNVKISMLPRPNKEAEVIPVVEPEE